MAVLAHAFVAALRDAPTSHSFVGVQEIADRLRASTNGLPPSGDFDRGREMGKQWASEDANLDELMTIAALGQRDDWKAIALPEGHSLLRVLAASGDAPAAEHGSVDLERDEFVTGLVAGATEVFRQVEPVLKSG